jgi:cell division protein FtsN
MLLVSCSATNNLEMRDKMAEEKDNNIEQTPDNTEDGLISLRGDAAAPKAGQDELMDDEEAIEHLLMDENFSSLDEPQDNQPDEIVPEEALDEIDEFADDDELADDADSPASGEQAQMDNNDDNLALEPAGASSEVDFLLSDFDISNDEEIDERPEEEKDDTVNTGLDESTGDVEADDITVDSIEEEENYSAMDNAGEETPAQSETAVTSQTEVEQVDLGPVLLQVNQLSEKLTGIQEQVSAQSSPLSEELEKLNKDQKRIKKTLVQNAKKGKLHTNITLAVAVFALLLAGGIMAVVFSLQSDVEQLFMQLASVEDEMSELDMQTNAKEMKQMRMSITDLAADFEKFHAQLEQLNNQPQPDIGEERQAVEAVQKKLSETSKQISANNKQLAVLKAKISKLERKRPSVKKTKVSRSAQSWSVNLVSFKKEWYANRKAAEFEKKGVPVEVEQVQIKGENWYRLRVSGFKTKEEAATYATRVKKALNLSSVWVANK